MNPIARSVLAVFAGMFVFVVLVVLVEGVSSLIYPPPPGLDLGDPKAVADYAAGVPPGAKAMVVAAWLTGTTGGALIAGLIAGRSRLAHGLVIAGAGVLAAVINLVMIPSPVWMWVLGLASFPAGAVIGAGAAGALSKAETGAGSGVEGPS